MTDFAQSDTIPGRWPGKGVALAERTIRACTGRAGCWSYRLSLWRSECAAAVWVLQSHLVPRSTYEHGEIAANLLAGRGFATHFLGAFGPTSQQAPIYPAVVCFAYAVGGVERPLALLLLELGQSVLAGVLVLGVIRLAQSVAPSRPWVAWTSGLVCALHPTLVYAATHVQVALLGTTLLIWSLAWAYRCGMSRRIRDATITGVLLGALALTDPILALAAAGVAWAVLAPWGRGTVWGERRIEPNAIGTAERTARGDRKARWVALRCTRRTMAAKARCVLLPTQHPEPRNFRVGTANWADRYFSSRLWR